MLSVLLGTNIQEKVVFSQACVILLLIGLMATHSLFVLFTVQSVCILLECFLVFRFFLFRESSLFSNNNSRAVCHYS